MLIYRQSNRSGHAGETIWNYLELHCIPTCRQSYAHARNDVSNPLSHAITIIPMAMPGYLL